MQFYTNSIIFVINSKTVFMGLTTYKNKSPMNGSTINLSNTFKVSSKGIANNRNSGYVRIVKYVDKKKHEKPQLYNADILNLLK